MRSAFGGIFPKCAKKLCRVLLLMGGLLAGSARDAAALTMILDFVSGSTTDVFGVQTTTANYSGFGFTGLNTAQIQQAVYSAVKTDYLSYPTMGSNPLSPLPNGQQLDIYFELSSGQTAPSNGDSEYFYVAIGTNTTGATFLGQACTSCVRNQFGNGPHFGAVSGMIVGSILVNVIDDLAGLASNDAQRINLLAGTVAHEIGHTLSLVHPNGQIANPGASTYDIMATGAAPTNMPNGQRVFDRAFSYVDFGQLITAVGLRDSVDVPEPNTFVIFMLGASVLVVLRQPRWVRAG